VYTTVKESPGELWLPGEVDPIERRSVTESAEALGIHGRPDGQTADEVKFLRERVLTWADNLRTGQIKKELAWYCLNSTILKTIEYPLMATTLTRHDTHQIMQPLLKAALNSCGIQKNLPGKLVYGTLRSRGLGIQDPFWTQLIQHLQAILRQFHRNTLTQMLLNENIELVQLHIGSEINFWELPLNNMVSWPHSAGSRNTLTQMLLNENIELVQLHIGSEINFGELPLNNMVSWPHSAGSNIPGKQALSQTPLILLKRTKHRVPKTM
jgi:hypothetical protein